MKIKVGDTVEVIDTPNMRLFGHAGKYFVVTRIGKSFLGNTRCWGITYEGEEIIVMERNLKKVSK